MALERRLLAMGVKDVVHAGGTEEALQYLRAPRQPLELIIANLLIPPADCISLLRALASGDHSNPVPLAVAGELDPVAVQAIESLAGALECPLAGFIGNPLHDTGLAHIFENILLRQQPQSKMRLVAETQKLSADSVLKEIELGQVQVLFQPIVAPRSLTLAGLEAMPYWRHPELGLIEPATLLPLLEQSGGLQRLTDEVMGQTARALRTLSDHGIETCASIRLPLTVLMPAQQQPLQQHKLCTSFAKAAAQYKLPHRRISFEITEQAGLFEQQTILETLSELRLMGFGLSLDCFGSGESSLRSLATLPVDTIKIDPRYTADLNTNSMHRKLLKSMLDLGRQVDVKVVATGIESRYQHQYLCGIGFQLLQGNFISKPLPVEEIARSYGPDAADISQAC
jgi:EAL domain-containing protein (putative c-di-GMP-specific phosphodiesterase class I)